jgi:hypothetical protein
VDGQGRKLAENQQSIGYGSSASVRQRPLCVSLTAVTGVRIPLGTPGFPPFSALTALLQGRLADIRLISDLRIRALDASRHGAPRGARGVDRGAVASSLAWRTAQCRSCTPKSPAGLAQRGSGRPPSGPRSASANPRSLRSQNMRLLAPLVGLWLLQPWRSIKAPPMARAARWPQPRERLCSGRASPLAMRRGQAAPKRGTSCRSI